MNADRLQQDHPCVIETIRRRYLHPPADLDVPYNLAAPNKADPSVGQAASILNYLGNQVKGALKTTNKNQSNGNDPHFRRKDSLSNAEHLTANI